MTPTRIPIVVALLAILTPVALSQGPDPWVERLRRNMARALDPRAMWTSNQRDVISWAFAVQEWTREQPDSTSAQLARGVLLECLASPAHGDGFLPNMLSRRDEESCGARVPGATATSMVVTIEWVSGRMSTTGCRAAAGSAYEKVLAKEPSNEEAQLRFAALRVREPRTPRRDDEPLLVKLAAGSPDRRFKFLASLFLGLGAEMRKDLPDARTRYDDARAVNPDWSSARQALTSVLLQQGETQLAKDLLPADTRPALSDPWYGYGCRIMTPLVSAELAEWKRKQGAR